MVEDEIKIDEMIIYSDFNKEVLSETLEKIKGGDFSIENAEELKRLLVGQLNNEINRTNGNASTKVIKFAEGSTSVCYITESDKENKYIYKVFHPQGVDYIQPIRIEDAEVLELFWLVDKPTKDQCKRFLGRFVRFVEQEYPIQKIKENANVEGINTFMNPKLLLTSKGLVWQVNHFFGCSLEEVLNQLTVEQVEDRYEALCKRLELIRAVAEHVEKLFHEIKLFHGDIKPENLFKIDLLNNGYIIENIDFDTCTTEEQIREGYLDKFMATTELFYDSLDVEEVLAINEFDFQQWAILDIRALSRVCMLALDIEGSFYKDVKKYSKSKSCNWIALYKDKLREKVFTFLGADKSLAALYISEEIYRFLFSCSKGAKRKEKIDSIDKFIKRLDAIIDLIRFNYGRKFDNKKITPEIIRCAGLKMLDKQIKDDEHCSTDSDAVSKLIKETHFV